MTGEQFLNSIRYLDSEINALDYERVRTADRRRDLLEKAECLTAALNGVNVQHSIGSKTESIGVELADTMTTEDVAKKLNEYQERINAMIDNLVDTKDRARSMIGKVPDARMRTLLDLRYISNLKWPTIADLMGYTENWVKIDLRQDAIREFEAIYKTTT